MSPTQKPLVFEISIPEDEHEALATALENHASDHVALFSDRRSGHVKNPGDKSEFSFQVLKGDKVKITVTKNPLGWKKEQFTAKIHERRAELVAMDEDDGD